MRRLGIIGGLSWESTAEYYRIINEEVAHRAGGLSSATLLLASVDFALYSERMKAGAWTAIGSSLVAEAKALARAGAEAILVASNTMNRFAPEIEEETGLPFLHIVDAAGRAIRARGFGKVGLLGTAYTMEGDFYRGRLHEAWGIQTLIPEADERTLVNDIIFEELCLGDFRERSRYALADIARGLREAGAEAVILGCTELPLVMREGDIPIPYLDTTRLHALAAADFVLGG